MYSIGAEAMEKLKVKFRSVFARVCDAGIKLAYRIKMRTVYAMQHKINSFHERIKFMVRAFVQPDTGMEPFSVHLAVISVFHITDGGG